MLIQLNIYQPLQSYSLTGLPIKCAYVNGEPNTNAKYLGYYSQNTVPPYSLDNVILFDNDLSLVKAKNIIDDYEDSNTPYQYLIVEIDYNAGYGENVLSYTGLPENFLNSKIYYDSTDNKLHISNGLGYPIKLYKDNVFVQSIQKGTFSITPQAGSEYYITAELIFSETYSFISDKILIPNEPINPAPNLIFDKQGTIFGTGEEQSRTNEITGDNLAIFRNFAAGHKDGVLQYENHDFAYSINDNTVHITDGTCFAYGYLAYSKAKDFTILPPAVESYYIIYAKLDKSIIPNTIELKIKNNYASPNIGINSFRQDVLSTVKTGVYEIPLWIFKVTNKGIDKESFENGDIRLLRNKVLKVEYSDTAHAVMGGGRLENGVTAVTQPITDKSKMVATTAFVQTAVQTEINK